jgi:hypothetical protein
MSLFLLAPDAQRLSNLFFLNRSAGPSTQPPLLRGRRAYQMALAVQVAFGVYLGVMNLRGSIQSWTLYGGGAPKSGLYGIWNIDQQSVDGQAQSRLVTDLDRWRRIVFDRPTAVSFQRMDDTFVRYGAAIDMDRKLITLTKGGDRNWKAGFAFQQPAAEQLILDGEMDGHKIHLQLHLFDRNKFLLVSRGFNWIQENPFNR